MHQNRLRAALVLALTLTAAACGGNRAITRIAPEQAIDLSGKWNDVDSRVVAEALIKQSFESPYGPNWAMRYAQAKGGTPPLVIVGSVKNRSMEHIQTETFVNDLERAFTNSGIVQVAQNKEARAEARAEREDQQEYAGATTRAGLNQERGADFMLQGEIRTIEDREGGRSVVFYQIDVTLVDLQTNVKTWAGQHKIKKFIDRARVGF